MMETMVSVARADLALPRDRRRVQKIAYRRNSGYGSTTARNVPVYSSSPEVSFPPVPVPVQQLQLQTAGTQFQPHDLMGTGYFNVNRPSTGNPATFSPVVHQNYPDDSSWISLSPPYTFASNPPSSPRTATGNDGYSPRSEVLQMSDNGQTSSWNGEPPRTSQAGAEMEDLSFAEMQLGSSLGSLDSIVFSARNSANSSLSDSYIFPPIYESGIDSPLNTNQLQDLALPDQFYQMQTAQMFDTSSASPLNPVSPLFSPEISFDDPGWYGSAYATDNFQSSDSTLIPQPDDLSPRTLSSGSMALNAPWDSQNGQVSNHQTNVNTGVVAFQPSRGRPFHTHLARQNYLDTNHMSNQDLRQPASPTHDSDGDSWRLISYPSSTYSASQGSPEPAISPAAHPPSPISSNIVVVQVSQPKSKVKIQSPLLRHESEKPHAHVFSTGAGISKQKLPKGRQGGLSAQQKKEARDVRDAKACWACHISKTKCSPCSSGKPCEQCTRLVGKRRFCLFSCFNDPLETLYTFFVPSYLTGHFTTANVEKFVEDNAASWGRQLFPIKMDWGYRKSLEAEVVTLALRSNAEMGFQHQTIFQQGMRPILLRKQSPPVGIPLAAMEDMEDIYSRYVQDIVENDFAEYASTAYTDQEDSDFTERLLSVVGAYHNAGFQKGKGDELLRRVLEIHVTAVILERSLVLDVHSQRQIESRMGERYPERSAPRCVQRQIKLAFFFLQQRRISRVLKDFGSLMWATNSKMTKDKEWALAFSVFTVLILVMDKTLGSAYYFCENQIQHKGRAAVQERAELEQLVRLVQKELFDRCKEIFHWKFKTRKGGKEACNPIRDGVDAFQGKSKDVDIDVIRFVHELQGVVGEFETDVRDHRSSRVEMESEYIDAGRLACIFLDDFLGR